MPRECVGRGVLTAPVCSGLGGSPATRRISALLAEAAREPFAAAPLKIADTLLEALAGLRLGIDLWKSQNTFFFSLRPKADGFKAAADRGEEQARDWLQAAERLAGRLGIRLKN